MRKILLVTMIAAVMSVALCVSAYAAGTISCSKQDGDTAKYACSLAADATNATGTFFLSGYIMRVVTNPGDGGEAPSGVWACTLADADGVDVLGGVVTGRSTTATEQVYPMAQDTTTVVAPYTIGLHTLTCTGIGDANTGVIYFYVFTQ
jgi:hypothetical protein